MARWNITLPTAWHTLATDQRPRRAHVTVIVPGDEEDYRTNVSVVLCRLPG